MNVKFVPVNARQDVEIWVDNKLHSTVKAQYDEHGEKYIHVPNLLRPEGDILTKGSFLHRVGDMVQHIRNGWGDAITTSNLIVKTESVVWFLNRTYGESFRKRSLEGWKDTEFAWAVFYHNSIFGDMPLTVHEDTKPISVTKFEGSADHFQIQYYDTEEAAQKFITDTLDAVRPLIEGLYRFPDIEENKADIDAYYYAHIKPLTGAKSIIALYGNEEGVDKRNPLYAGQIIRKYSGTYNVRKVFLAHMNAGKEMFMCKGDALDRALDDTAENLIWDIRGGATVTEECLNYHGSESELFPKVLNPTAPIYRLQIRGFSDDCTHWYRYIDECFDAPEYETLKKKAEILGREMILVEATLHPQELQPIIPTADKPYDMLLSNGKKGLMARAALRPDEVGKYSGKEKIYFPDRSCKDKLCAGMMRVTEVNDRGNYGFIKGSMVKFSQPTESELAEYLMSDAVVITARESVNLCFITNPKWGSAIQWVPNSRTPSSSFIAVDDTGTLKRQDILAEYDHQEDTVTETVDLMDFICTGYTGKSFRELSNIVPRISGLWKLQMEQSIKFISDDFDEAIECGLIDLRKYNNFHVCIMDYDKLCKAAHSLQDGLLPVLEEAKRINEEAQIRFTNLVRKGKLKL